MVAVVESKIQHPYIDCSQIFGWKKKTKQNKKKRVKEFTLM